MDKLIEKANKNAEKYGVSIDLVEIDGDQINVFANSCQMVIYDDGGCSLWDREGFRIKDCSKMSYGFRALSKMEYVD